MPIFTPYLDAEDLNELANYQYKSGTYTVLDNLMSDYWWEPLILITPSWVAPNLLTLLGFLSSALALGITLACNPNLDTEISTFQNLSIAGLIFLYQTLDALDGKQARTTKNSSPLGTLFDHGCDVLTTSFFVLVQLGNLRLGVSSVSVITVMLATHALQFVCIWYEYYFNVFMHSRSVYCGVTEVQVFIIFMQLVSPLGLGWIWDFEVMGLIKMNTLFGVGLLINNLEMIIRHHYCGLKQLYIAATGADSAPEDYRTFKKALFQVLNFYTYMCIEYLFLYSTVIHGNARPGLAALTVCVGYSTICVRFILASCAKRVFRPMQWPLVPIFVFTLVLTFFNALPSVAQKTLGAFYEFTVVHTNSAVSCICLLQSVYFLDFVVESIRGMAKVMKINVFTVRDAKKAE